MHEGVASCWLARLQEGDRVPCFLRHSTFKLPRDPATPVCNAAAGMCKGNACLLMVLVRQAASWGFHALEYSCKLHIAPFLKNKTCGPRLPHPPTPACPALTHTAASAAPRRS